ncbi:MAG: MFS family permease [Francisellaceae bacterium]|jgi:MFS family permease
MTTQKISSFIKLSFGNILEWYDFSLYIYFATYIAATFFPNENHYYSMFFTFATFFIGSLARPLGGLFFGSLADKFGYRLIINICVILMGMSTFAVAFLPTYGQLGILAPILLVALRIIQGLSVGGQFPSLLTLGVNEHGNKKGFIIGLVFSISSLGFLIASLSGAISEYFLASHTQLVWRLPFLFSGFLFIIYLWLNKNEKNYTPNKSEVKREQLLVSLLHQWKGLLAVILLTTMIASLYYFVFTYLVNYQIVELKINATTAFLLNSIVLLLVCFLYPFFGYVADRVGHIKVFIICLVLLMLLTYPLLYLFNTKIFIYMLFSLGIFAILMAGMQGAISPFFTSVFDAEWQATACAIAYSVGNGISGSAPLVASTFVYYYGHYGLSIYALILVAIGTVGAILIMRHKHI